MSTEPDRFTKIWRTVCDIPYGMVASYGQVARLAGMPRGARIVGYALGKHPKEMNVPWHRVVNAQGRISFPKDSRAYRLQADRLGEEGVELIKGRINLKKHGWDPNLDELLWKPSEHWD